MKSFIVHKTLSLGYTSAETEDCKKNYFLYTRHYSTRGQERKTAKKIFTLHFQPKMGVILYKYLFIHQALQYLTGQVSRITTLSVRYISISFSPSECSKRCVKVEGKKGNNSHDLRCKFMFWHETFQIYFPAFLKMQGGHRSGIYYI